MEKLCQLDFRKKNIGRGSTELFQLPSLLTSLGAPTIAHAPANHMSVCLSVRT